MLPDVPTLNKGFDYTVPAGLAGGPEVGVGAMVRVALNGRRVGGWVVADGVEPAAGMTLCPLARFTGLGPPVELVELARWAAWRWAGRPATFLRTASPVAAVRGLPPPPEAGPVAAAAVHDPLIGGMVDEALAGGACVVRLPPVHDPFPLVAAAAGRGPALILSPSTAAAAHLALRLRRQGTAVALVPREWAKARAGGCTVVGARAAAWAPVPGLAAVVVLDGHDEGYQEERAPTWNARDVAVERARRAAVPCVVVSPCPDLVTLELGRLLVPGRKAEREGWPVLDVVDRRDADPRTGQYSTRLVDLLRSGRRVVCVLNRKGRARLLACGACGELTRCQRCRAALDQVADEAGSRLWCRRCDHGGPWLCPACGAQRLRALRLGVTRVRDELEALAGVAVGEVTADSEDPADQRVLIGTEAVLHRVADAEAVAFVDFDQELLAPRYRAAEQALALLARASRLVGGRASGGRVLVQTRLPDHPVIAAALHGDPGRLVPVENAMRTALRFPPSAALALVSGAAAEAFVDQLGGAGRGVARALEVLGPADGRWLLRAPDHSTLCDALAAVARPSGRLRVEVDPLRA